MEDIEVLNKILYDFLYDTDDLYIEDFYLIDNFRSIILDNKTILKPSSYRRQTSLNKNIKYSYEFLKTLDERYADKLMKNIEDGVFNFYQRAEGETTNASLEVDDEKKQNIIILPFDKTIEDSYTITHEQLHDTNMDPNRLNPTCSLFTEMISFLGELLQRDYFEKKSNTPKEYRKNMSESFFATRIYAISMDFELELIKRFIDKGFINFQDIRDICKGKTTEELETISIELEKILDNGELNYYKSQNYIISNVLACYLHERILEDPKKIKEFNELNKMINIYPIDRIFDYLELDMKQYRFLNLTDDSYKILRKCYNNEIKRL